MTPQRWWPASGVSDRCSRPTTRTQSSNGQGSRPNKTVRDMINDRVPFGVSGNEVGLGDRANRIRIAVLPTLWPAALPM